MFGIGLANAVDFFEIRLTEDLEWLDIWEAVKTSLEISSKITKSDDVALFVWGRNKNIWFPTSEISTSTLQNLVKEGQISRENKIWVVPRSLVLHYWNSAGKVLHKSDLVSPLENVQVPSVMISIETFAFKFPWFLHKTNVGTEGTFKQQLFHDLRHYKKISHGPEKDTLNLEGLGYQFQRKWNSDNETLFWHRLTDEEFEDFLQHIYIRTETEPKILHQVGFSPYDFTSRQVAEKSSFPLFSQDFFSKEKEKEKEHNREKEKSKVLIHEVKSSHPSSICTKNSEMEPDSVVTGTGTNFGKKKEEVSWGGPETMASAFDSSPSFSSSISS